MREIKFRAWSTVEEKMYPSVGFQDSDCGRVLIEEQYMVGGGKGISVWTGSKTDGVLMQFTGLKDKNGVEIYEGDIIQCDEIDDSDTGQGKTMQTFPNAIVAWYMSGWYYCPKGNINQPHQQLHWAAHIKIIGNIYQNKELLT